MRRVAQPVHDLGSGCKGAVHPFSVRGAGALAHQRSSRTGCALWVATGSGLKLVLGLDFFLKSLEWPAMNLNR